MATELPERLFYSPTGRTKIRMFPPAHNSPWRNTPVQGSASDLVLHTMSPRTPEGARTRPTVNVDATLSTDWSDLEMGLLRRHFTPRDPVEHVATSCRGQGCASKVPARVAMPIRTPDGPGVWSMSESAHRNLMKQINFGSMYGGKSLGMHTDSSLLGQLGFRKAPERKRKRRIAKKIAKRGGWMTCVKPAFADMWGHASRTFGRDVAKELKHKEQLAFDNRSDVVEMREAMLAAGVPREERQKAYRALRRMTPVKVTVDVESELSTGVGGIDYSISRLHDSMVVNVAKIRDRGAP